jgi:MarR family transcriptional regulator, organic hydroperoxide resistance regulator
MTRKNPLIKYVVRLGELAVKNIESELARHGLGDLASSHLEIITYLIRKKEAPMQVLADALERDKSTLTVLVRKLTELGFVKQKTASDDGRVRMVSLTPKGAGLKKTTLRIFLATERALEKNMSKTEKEALFILLEKAYNGLKVF